MSETLTQEDVKLLVDMLYLPHKQGLHSCLLLAVTRTYPAFTSVLSYFKLLDDMFKRENDYINFYNCMFRSDVRENAAIF